jgi:hypothetical protein
VLLALLEALRLEYPCREDVSGRLLAGP